MSFSCIVINAHLHYKFWNSLLKYSFISHKINSGLIILPIVYVTMINILSDRSINVRKTMCLGLNIYHQSIYLLYLLLCSHVNFAQL